MDNQAEIDDNILDFYAKLCDKILEHNRIDCGMGIRLTKTECFALSEYIYTYTTDDEFAPFKTREAFTNALTSSPRTTLLTNDRAEVLRANLEAENMPSNLEEGIYSIEFCFYSYEIRMLLLSLTVSYALEIHGACIANLSKQLLDSILDEYSQFFIDVNTLTR